MREPTVEPGGAAPLEISYRVWASPYCHFLLFLDLALRRAVFAADAKTKENFEERESHARACSWKLFSASAEGHPILGIGLSPGFSVQSWESDLLASFLHVLNQLDAPPLLRPPHFTSFSL